MQSLIHPLFRPDGPIPPDRSSWDNGYRSADGRAYYRSQEACTRHTPVPLPDTGRQCRTATILLRRVIKTLS
jgi:hypothetical protein